MEILYNYVLLRVVLTGFGFLGFALTSELTIMDVTSALLGKMSDNPCRTDYPGTCDLTGHDLTEVPEIPAGEMYRNMLMDKNQIRSAPQGMLAGHDTQYLSMESNAVSSITDDMLTGAYHLKHLNMAHNKVIGVDEVAFKDTKNLARIDVNDNRLGWLPPKAFCDLRNATTILLHNNRLSTLRVHPGCEPFNVTMSASGNPFCCDWAMAWLKRSEKLNKLRWEAEFGIVLSPTCDNFQGRHWNNISETDLWNVNCPVKPEMEAQRHTNTANDVFSKVQSTALPNSKSGTSNSVLVQVLVPSVIVVISITTAALVYVFKRRRNAKTDIASDATIPLQEAGI